MVSEASLLAMVQISRIGLRAWEAHQEGNLTQEELDQAWDEIGDRVTAARSNWRSSKDSPAAKARQDEQ